MVTDRHETLQHAAHLAGTVHKGGELHEIIRGGQGDHERFVQQRGDFAPLRQGGHVGFREIGKAFHRTDSKDKIVARHVWHQPFQLLRGGLQSLKFRYGCALTELTEGGDTVAGNIAPRKNFHVKLADSPLNLFGGDTQFLQQDSGDVSESILLIISTI